MQDIHARAPIDRVAVRVVMFLGEHFNPDKIVLTNDSETAHRVIRFSKAMRCNPSFDDLTGKRVGRFTVMGLAQDFKGSWVVRCDCGRYSTRKKKSLTNHENVQDRCEHCRHLAFLQRDEVLRRTMKDADIRDF